MFFSDTVTTISLHGLSEEVVYKYFVQTKGFQGTLEEYLL